MVAVPAPLPVTTPDEVTDAGEAEEDHAPPGTELASVVVYPWHTASVPLMADGAGLSVTVAVAIHAPGMAYVIVAVPAATPVTLPEELTDAVVASELLQVPPDGVLLSKTDNPWHTPMEPVMAVGVALTTIAALPVIAVVQVEDAPVARTV